MEHQLNDRLEVIWMDAHSVSGWTDEDQLQNVINNEGMLAMITIGYFVCEDALYIYVTQTRDTKTPISRGNVFLIPKGSIQKIDLLSKTEAENTLKGV